MEYCLLFKNIVAFLFLPQLWRIDSISPFVTRFGFLCRFGLNVDIDYISHYHKEGSSQPYQKHLCPPLLGPQFSVFCCSPYPIVWQPISLKLFKNLIVESKWPLLHPFKIYGINTIIPFVGHPPGCILSPELPILAVVHVGLNLDRFFG